MSEAAESNFEKVVGTPLSFTHTTKDDKGSETKTVYILEPLTLRTWGRYFNWVAMRPYFQALDSGVSKADCKDLLKECSTTFYDINSIEVRLSLLTPIGLTKLVEIALETKYSSLPLSFIQKLIDDCEEEIQGLLLRFLSINGIEFKKEGDPNLGNEATPNLQGTWIGS